MRLNKFLLVDGYDYKEGFRVERELEEAEFMESVKKYCSKSFFSNTRIYRGDKIKKPYMYIDKFTRERTSPYADNNVYNVLLSNLPSWSEYPRRNMSMICSTDKRKAGNYNAGFYIVYPFDNAKIGVCPADDIWDSFSGIQYMNTLNLLNQYVGNLIEFCDEYLLDILGGFNFLKKSSYNELKNKFDIIDDVFTIEADLITFKNKYSSWRFFEEIDYIDFRGKPSRTGKKLIDCFNDVLNPHKNGFSLVKAGKRILGDNEVWFEPPCLMKISVY